MYYLVLLNNFETSASQQAVEIIITHYFGISNIAASS